MSRPRKDEPIDLASLFKEAGERLGQSAREPNILMYKPHHKQYVFHTSTDYGRFYLGGNRSGKTYGAIAEDIWWATGTHPYIETPPPPVRGRVVGVDFKKGVDQILVPLFKRLLVPSMLVNGSWEDSFVNNVLTFANGSTIEFMSYEQDTEKFAGTSRHFIHYDEEPPKNVFDECQMRIADTEGRFWVSMTPVEGITWLYDSIYIPVTDSESTEIIEEAGNAYGQVVRNKEMEMLIVEVDSAENPYLSKKGMQRSIALLDDEDKLARQSGKFVEMSGLVYKSFDINKHVIEPFVPPADWDWYMSIDHGWNNPTAILWHAVSPDGTVYTFSEHYASQMTIEQHATVIHMREAMWGREPDLRVGDPAMKQVTAVTGTSIIQEYADREVYISVDQIPRDVAIGIARIQQYLRVDTETGKPKWLITENCVNLIKEMRRLRWKKYASKKMQYENNKSEQIHKKDDHACDSARYFFTCMPELSSSDYVSPDAPDEPKPKTDSDFGLALLRSLTEGRPMPEDDLEKNSWDIYEGIDLSDSII